MLAVKFRNYNPDLNEVIIFNFKAVLKGNSLTITEENSYGLKTISWTEDEVFITKDEQVMHLKKNSFIPYVVHSEDEEIKFITKLAKFDKTTYSLLIEYYLYHQGEEIGRYELQISWGEDDVD